jgi:cysteine-rich repeat protein
MTPSVSDGQAQFAIADDAAVDLVNPVLTPACGIAQPICNVVASAIFGFIEDEFEAALASTVLPLFPPLFETFVEAHDLPSSIATDAPTPGEIGVDATLGSLRVVGTAPTGALEIGARTQAYPQTRAPGIPAGAAGAVQRSGAIPAFLASPLGQSLRDDYVNQVLWSLWYEGGFESLELTSDSVTHGLPAQALSASALLPPILRPGTTGSEIEIALGDLRLVARLDLAQVLGPPAHGTVDVTALVSTRVRGMPAVDDARQKLGFEAAAAEASVEIVSPDDAALAAALEAPIGSFVESWLPPVLERLVSGIRLPATPVSTTGFELGLGSGSADRPDADQTRLSGLLVERPRCGDGLLRGGEACDDGDGSLGDGCDDACSVEPGYACSGQPSVCTYVADVDADGIVDIADNCPYSANAAQADVGGVGDGSAPDGIGDACQCGDATGDGRISDDDVTAVRDGLRGDSSAVLAPERCSVSGALDAILAATGLRRDCDIADASRLARALLGLAPSLGQLCAPALP